MAPPSLTTIAIHTLAIVLVPLLMFALVILVTARRDRERSAIRVTHDQDRRSRIRRRTR
jgi:hypothetical protein